VANKIPGFEAGFNFDPTPKAQDGVIDRLYMCVTFLPCIHV